MSSFITYIETLVLRVRHRDEGQALVEYALILGLVSIVSIAALTLLGGNISAALNTVAGKV